MKIMSLTNAKGDTRNINIAFRDYLGVTNPVLKSPSTSIYIPNRFTSYFKGHNVSFHVQMAMIKYMDKFPKVERVCSFSEGVRLALFWYYDILRTHEITEEEPVINIWRLFNPDDIVLEGYLYSLVGEA